MLLSIGYELLVTLTFLACAAGFDVQQSPSDDCTPQWTAKLVRAIDTLERREMVSIEPSSALLQEYRNNRTSDGLVDIASLITFGIKASSKWDWRRATLHYLLVSIRSYYGHAVRVVVADENDPNLPSNFTAEWLHLSPLAGLSAGRNRIVHATRTPFVLIMDDDVRFDDSTTIETLLAQLLDNPDVAVATACYVDPAHSLSLLTEGSVRPCYAHEFVVEDSGRSVRMLPLRLASSECVRTHTGHSFFLGRTSVLREYRWDQRMKVGELETFYFQLYLNSIGVITCPNVRALHSLNHRNTKGVLSPTAEYTDHSLRHRVQDYFQYLCKNFPQVANFETPDWTFNCERRTACHPDWDAEFLRDSARVCVTMKWDASDDTSMVSRPVQAPQAVPGRLSARDSAAPADEGGQLRPKVPLFALVFTRPAAVATRNELRDTWLRIPWGASEDDSSTLVPWRYTFVVGVRESTSSGGRSERRSMRALSQNSMSAREGANTSSNAPRRLAMINGDMLVIRMGNYQECEYRQLTWKTLHAFAWARANIDFEVLFKVDDDTVVHVSRLWGWLLNYGRDRWPNLYAGTIAYGSRVIRATHAGADPMAKAKWHVPRSIWANDTFPPYALGFGYLLGLQTIETLFEKFDAWTTAGKPVVHLEDAFVGILLDGVSSIKPSHFAGQRDARAGQIQVAGEPVEASVLVHGYKRVERAPLRQWLQRAHTVGRVSSTSSGAVKEEAMGGACSCDALVHLCLARLVHHGCWRACCRAINWPEPNPSAQQCPTELKAGADDFAAPTEDFGQARTSGRVTQPQTRYLIMTAARSASTTLCWALDRHPQVVCNYEYLQLPAPTTTGAPAGTTALQHTLNLDQALRFNTKMPSKRPPFCAKQLGHALDVYWNDHCHFGACGFKIFRSHLDDTDADCGSVYAARRMVESMSRSMSAPGVDSGCRLRIIILERRDKLAAHNSIVRATQTGEWQTVPGGQLQLKGHCPPGSTDWGCKLANLSVDGFAAEITGWTNWARGLRAQGAEVFEAATEDLLVGARGSKRKDLNVELLNSIARFLQVAPTFQAADVDTREQRVDSGTAAEKYNPVKHLDKLYHKRLRSGESFAAKATERHARSAPRPPFPKHIQAVYVIGRHSSMRMQRSMRVVRAMGYAPSESPAVLAADDHIHKEGRAWRPTERGRKLAHHSLWTKIAKSGGSIVFEDDITLSIPSIEAGRLINATISKQSWVDLIFLGYRQRFSSSHAYYLTMSGANKVLQHCNATGPETIAQLFKRVCESGSLSFAHAQNVAAKKDTDFDGIVKHIAWASMSVRQQNMWNTVASERPG